MKAYERESQLNIPLRIIVIDDNLDWCNVMKRMITGLHYTLDIAQTAEEAQRRIEQAEQRKDHYAIAIIDMNFKEGDNEILAGIDLIDDIKRNHPYIACVVASGERASPDYVLDLRDEHQLDYYLQKERISRDKLKKAIERCRERLGAVWAEYLPQSSESRAGAQQSVPAFPAPGSAGAQLAHPVREHPSVESPKSTLHDSIRVQLDFQVAPSGPTITWRAPLIGRVMTRLVEPYTPDELPLIIRALNVLQYPNYPHPQNDAERRGFTFTDVQQDYLTRLGLWREERVAADAAELIGQALYQALGPDGQDLLRTIRNAGISGGNTASYILRFPPEGISLAALPWELLWDRAKNQAVLIRGNQIDSCERYLDLDVALPPPIRGGQKLHLLALSPQYGIPSSLREQERQVRREIWDRLRDTGRITYGEVSPLTMSDLNNYAVF